MNSITNSYSEQCTELKLSRVYSAHTLTQSARTGRTHCAQAGRVVGLCPAESWLVAGRVVAMSQAWPIVSRASLRRIVVRCCAVSQRSVVVSRPKVAPSAMIQIFVSRPCSQPHALRTVSRACPAVSQAAWPYRGLLHRVVARPCALPPSLASHNTVCCTVTQTKKKFGQ